MNRTYQTREFSFEEIVQIYETYSPQFFPAAERKPLSAIRRLCKQGIYRGFGLYLCGEGDGTQDAVLAGYALLVCPKAFGNLLLDYFAILPPLRRQGAGRFFLSRLREIFADSDGIYIESEAPQPGSPEEDAQNARIRFYEAAGAKRTTITGKLFGVDYDILFLPCSRSDRLTIRHLVAVDAIYREMFTPQQYEEKVFLEV